MKDMKDLYRGIFSVGLEDEEDTVNKDNPEDLSNEPTDQNEMSSEVNKQEDIKDESQQTTSDSPTNQPEEAEDGKTIMEKELGYYARFLDFSQFKEAEDPVKIEDYYTTVKKSVDNPVNSKIRVRRIEGKEGVRHELTMKVGDDETKRLENTMEISEDMFNLYKNMAHERTMKHRYHFNNEDGSWCVDLFPNGKGGYFDWGRIEVEVKEIPQTAPTPPVKTEELIYPKGHNKDMTDEEAEAKVKEITTKIDVLHQVNPVVAKLRERVQASLQENEARVGNQDQEPLEDNPDSTEVPSEEEGEEGDETPEEKPLDSDSISRDKEQVDENEEQMEENKEAKDENETDDSSDDSSETDSGDSDTSDDTDTDADDNSDGDDVVSDADVDADSDDSESGEDEETLQKDEESKEGNESLLEDMDSLVQFKSVISGSQHISSVEAYHITEHIRQLTPVQFQTAFRYQSALEDIQDNPEGFKEETLDVLENGIEAILHHFKLRLRNQTYRPEDEELSESVNLNPSRLRVKAMDISDESEVGNQGHRIIRDIESLRTILNQLSTQDRINNYEAMLSACKFLIGIYHEEKGITNKTTEALKFFVNAVMEVILPPTVQNQGKDADGFDTFILETQSHHLVYKVKHAETRLQIRMSSSVHPTVSMEELVTSPNPPKDQILDAIDNVSEDKVKLADWLAQVKQSLPEHANDVRKTLREINTSYLGKGEVADSDLFITLDSVLSLVSNEVEFLASLSHMDADLKNWVSEVLQVEAKKWSV